MEAHKNGQDWVCPVATATLPPRIPPRRGVLTQGTYRGTFGVLLHLWEDIEWTDVTERNGKIRSRPVAWIALAGGPDRVVRN